MSRHDVAMGENFGKDSKIQVDEMNFSGFMSADSFLPAETIFQECSKSR